MSKKFLVPIDMNGLEIQNFLAHNLATAPSGVAGKIYFNTADNKLYYHDGTNWVALTKDTDTHYTTHLYAGSGSAANAETTNGNTKITVTDNSTVRNSVKISGTGATTVTSDASGNISINSPATPTYTSVTGKPTSNQTPAFGGTATISQVSQSTTGQVSVTDRTIKIPDTIASTSAPGLMSSADKTKLNNVVAGEVDIVAGANVSLTYDSTNNKVVISAVNTTYTIDTEVTEDSTNPVSGGAVYDHVAESISEAISAADAMRFKGTIGTGGDVTSLPTTGVKVGDTYRVITAGTYAGEICEVGDLIIAISETPTWTVAQTNINGAITSLSNGTGISVTGSGSSRTIGLASGVITAKSVGDTTAQTPGFGGTFNVLSQTVDTYGRTTATAAHTVTIPNTAASTTAAGLMSKDDKIKLNGIAEGAEVNRTYTSVTGKPTGNSTPGFGGSVTISQISQSTTGQITATDRTITIPSTAATTSAKGLVQIGNGLNVSSGTISTKVQNGSVTLSAGSTSTTASVTSMIAYSAYDATTGEELVIDATQGSSAVTFSIASAYTNAITIKYTFAA